MVQDKDGVWCHPRMTDIRRKAAELGRDVVGNILWKVEDALFNSPNPMRGYIIPPDGVELFMLAILNLDQRVKAYRTALQSAGIEVPKV